MAIVPVGGGSAQQTIQGLVKGAQKQPGAAKSFQNVMQSGSQKTAGAQVNQPQMATQVQGVSKPKQAMSPLKSMINSMSKAHTNMDNLMKEAMSGKNMSPGKLLVLQSKVYAYSTNIEAASKIVESATNAIKTTMQTQV